MALTHDYFWRQILRCSAQGIRPINDLLSESEISDSKMPIRSNQQIFWLQVSISDLALMKILQCQCDLCNVKQRNIVWEDIFFPQKPENLTALDEIEHKVKVDFVLKSLNKVDNERVRGPSKNILFILDVLDLL